MLWAAARRASCQAFQQALSAVRPDLRVFTSPAQQVNIYNCIQVKWAHLRQVHCPYTNESFSDGVMSYSGWTVVLTPS